MSAVISMMLHMFISNLFRDIHLWFLLFYMIIVIGKMILFSIKYPDPARYRQWKVHHNFKSWIFWTEIRISITLKEQFLDFRQLSFFFQLHFSVETYLGLLSLKTLQQVLKYKSQNWLYFPNAHWIAKRLGALVMRDYSFRVVPCV